jgi:hypothetical protein
VRCLKEFALTALFQFAGAVAWTNPLDTHTIQIVNFAVSYSFLQFAAQIAAYGVLGNPGLTLTHVILVGWSREEIGVSIAIIGAQFAGGFAAMGIVLALGGSVEKYVPIGSASDSGLMIMFLDGCFSFLLGYIHLKLVWTSPKGDPPRINSPYAPLATTAFVYIAIVSLSPFTGAGINLVRSIAPCAVTGRMPSSVVNSIVGQLVGYGLSALCFIGLYMRNVQYEAT